MNVLNPDKRAAMATLLKQNVSQREISRNTGIDRKTIRKYIQQNDLGRIQNPPPVAVSNSPTLPTGQVENPPSRPPVSSVDTKQIPFHARSACEAHRQWIEQQVRLGRNAMSIYQDLVEQFSFNHKYNSVKRFVRKLKHKAPQTVRPA
jgi:transposase